MSLAKFSSTLSLGLGALIAAANANAATGANTISGRIEVHLSEQYRVLIDSPAYTTSVDVFLDDPSTPRALSVLKLTKDGREVLNRATSLGDARSFWGLAPGQLHWQSAQQSALDPRGNYHLDLKLTDGTSASLDFKVAFAMPASVPQMASPQTGELFSTATPTLQLGGYRSVDNAEFSRQDAQVFVNANPGPSAVTVFSRDLESGQNAQAVEVANALADGEYVAFYNVREHATSGRFDLIREIGQSTHFLVRASAGSPLGVPPEVAGVRLRFRRVHRLPTQDHVFQIRVDVDADPDLITSLKLKDAKGSPVFDSREGIGHAGGDLGESPTLIYSAPARPDDHGGVYELRIGVAGKGQPAIVPILVPPNSWSTKDAQPFLTPANGEDVISEAPTFRVHDFRSPQFLPIEERLTEYTINYHPTNNPATFVSRWRTLVPNPVPLTVTLGQGIAASVAPLIPGEYRFGAGYIERRRSGTVWIERESATIACFWLGSGTCRVN